MTNLSERRVLGIDPGLNVTGYGVINTDGRDVSLVEAGVIRSSRRRTLPQRLQQIFDGVQDACRSFSPDAMSLE